MTAALEGGEWSAARLRVPGPVWTGGKSCPHWDSIPDRPTRSQSLYRLSYPAHSQNMYLLVFHDKNRYANASYCYLMRTQAVFLNPINAKINDFSVKTKTTQKSQYVEEFKVLSPVLRFRLLQKL